VSRWMTPNKCLPEIGPSGVTRMVFFLAQRTKEVEGEYCDVQHRLRGFSEKDA
jgi:hypothetical protein